MNKFNRILIWVVPSLFFLAMTAATYSGFHRKSGITGIDAAKIQQMRMKS